VRVGVGRDAVGPDGLVGDERVRTAMRKVLELLAEQVPART